MKRIILSFVLLVLILSSATASDSLSNKWRIGAFSDLNLNFHSADFQKLPGVPNCCPLFESGFGAGFSLGLLTEYPLSKKFYLGLRADYNSFGGTLKKNESTTMIVAGNLTDGSFVHTLDASIKDVGLSLYLSFNPAGGLLFSMGTRLGFITQSTFSQKETISGPGTFLDTNGKDSFSAIRNIFSGDIPNANAITFSGLWSASFEFPLNKKKTLFLAPEMTYFYNFIPVAQNLKWKVSSLHLGLAIKFLPESGAQKIYEKKEQIDTIRIESGLISSNTFSKGKPVFRQEEKSRENETVITDITLRTDTIFSPKSINLKSDITTVGLDKGGNEIPVSSINMEEFISRNLQPLLPYIFFDDGSATIPDRYTKISSQDAMKFKLSNLYKYETLPTYYQILNILGKRMLENPKSKITLTGCHSNVGSESNNTSLSNKRAEAVKDYLMKIWGIDNSRIITKARDLPEKSSLPETEEQKAAENKRVEIESSDFQIVAPVLTTDTLRRSSIESIRFKPNINSEAGIKQVNLKVYQDKSLILDTNNNYSVKNIDWHFLKNSQFVPKTNSTLEYNLNVVDNKNQTSNTESKAIPIKLITVQEKRLRGKISDKEFDKYSLILFNFDKSDISGINENIIDIIKHRLKYNSTVKITGYTDILGLESYNKELSLRRATSTAKALKLDYPVVNGLGNETLLYNNDLPEGRFYCRTVVIDVETPITK
ncbi:MAG: OmpA family protein [FCB group bacterium]